MNLKEAIRDVLGVKEVYGTNEWPTKCFSPEHEDNSPSASVNVEKGLWVCYSCGRGGSVQSLLDGQPIADPSEMELLNCVEANLRLAETASHIDPSHYSESWLRIYQSKFGPHPYWKERGVSEQAVEHFCLGYDYETNCVTYPIRDIDGSVLGVVRRKIDWSKPKYVYPKHLNVHDLLFRYHEATYGSVVVLVEGALDAIALWEVGIFALGIYGSRLSAAQEHLIIRLNPSVVIPCFDNDDAGRAALERVVTDTEIGLVSRIKVPDWTHFVGFKDVDELIPEQRCVLVRSAVDIDGC